MNLLNVNIRTERLKHIPITLDYVETIFNEFTDEITTYMSPQPAKEIKETEDFVEISIKGLKDNSNLQLVILNKETDEFLGCSGLHNIDREKPLEFGVRLKKSARGKGFGKEAILGIKKRTDENLDYDYILYPVDKNNTSSIKIAEAMDGKIEREYTKENTNGTNLNILEYRIYPKPRLAKQ